MGEIVSKKMFARMVGKSERWIGNWIEEGMPTAGGGGKGRVLEIDTEVAIDWMVRRAVRRQVGDEDEDEDGVGSAGAEDRLLKKARREKLQIEIDLARRRLVPLDAVGRILQGVGAVFATQLDSLSSRLASDLAVIDDPAKVRERIHAETRRIRGSTSERLDDAASELVAELDALDSIDGVDGEGTAAEDE
jgi:terminase small subunit / prophage DNA-packing protein